jgi:N6-adenosine-specific RNA methylase IME4
VTPKLPAGPFDLIYADPPWDFTAWSDKSSANARLMPYQCMDLPAICRLPVSRVAADDAMLAIWVFGAEPPETLKVIEAWGFGMVREGLTWVKISKAGKPAMGLGHTTRKETESLWLAKRGKGLPCQDHGVHQTITAQRREHSRKPDEAYTALERLYGDVRRLELFSRRERPGWSRWGNQLLPPDAEQRLPFAPEELFEELAHPRSTT